MQSNLWVKAECEVCTTTTIPPKSTKSYEYNSKGEKKNQRIRQLESDFAKRKQDNFNQHDLLLQFKACLYVAIEIL